MNKTLKIITLCSVVFIFGLLLSQPLIAEVGNSGGFGGGSSSGGSSGGFGGGSIFLLSGSPIGIAILIIIVVVKIMAASKQGNASGEGPNQNSAFNTRDLSAVESNAVTSIQASDPNFSAQKFKGYAAEVYITLQEAWEAKNWKSVRSFESDALFNQHNRQLQEYINQKKTNHLDMQDVRQVDIGGYSVDGNQEVLIVRLNASLLDYTTNDETGSIVDGNNKMLQNRSYFLEFIRSKGVQTKVEEILNTTNCPNCGAPTSITTSGECAYCHSTITSGQYGWVLNKYGAWN